MLRRHHKNFIISFLPVSSSSSPSFSSFQRISHRFSSSSSNNATSSKSNSSSSSALLSFSHDPETRSFIVKINNNNNQNNATKKNSKPTTKTTASSTNSFNVPYIFLADHSLTLLEPNTFQKSIPIDFVKHQENLDFSSNNGDESVIIDHENRIVFFKYQHRDTSKKAASTKWLAVPVDSFFQLYAAREGQQKQDPELAGEIFEDLIKEFINSSSSSSSNHQASSSRRSTNDDNTVLEDLIQDAETKSSRKLQKSTNKNQETIHSQQHQQQQQQELNLMKSRLSSSYQDLDAVRTAVGLTGGHLRLAVSNWLQHRERVEPIHEVLEEVSKISSSSASSSSSSEFEKQSAQRLLKLNMKSFASNFGNPTISTSKSVVQTWKKKDIVDLLNESNNNATASRPFVSNIFPKEMQDFIAKNNNNNNSSSLASSSYQTDIQQLLSSPSSQSHRSATVAKVAHSIEKFGFCVIEDPVLEFGLPNPLSLTTAEEPTGMPSCGMIHDLLHYDQSSSSGKENNQDHHRNNSTEKMKALKVVHRRNSVDFIMKFLFGVLMNSHYGMTPIWGNFTAPTSSVALSSEGNNNNSNDDSKHNTSNNIEPAAPTAEIDHLDTAYLTCGIDLHTDQTYALQSPKLQGFGLIHNDPNISTGGKNVLADGFAIAEFMAENYPKEFATLLSNSCPAYYCKDGRLLGGFRSVFEFVASKKKQSSSSLSSSSTSKSKFSSSSKSISQISFNAYDRAPAVVFDMASNNNNMKNDHHQMKKMIEFYRAYSLFGDLCHDRVKNDVIDGDDNNTDKFSFELQPQIGQLLIFDNHRCLHARTAFTGPRIMCGSYIGMDDYFSALNQYQL